MAQLLVSVRCADEVAPALAGGAALIDVKEPANGPLGRATERTVAEVVRAVGGQRPVSAARGELFEEQGGFASVSECAYLKWGLKGAQGRDWREGIEDAIRCVAENASACQVVTVAYADWRQADAPSVEEVCAFACRRPGSVFLIDTFTKSCPGGARPTLLDFLSVGQVCLLRRLCADAGVRLALAGCLDRERIERLLPVEPDWFAVRGAACIGGERGACVDEGRVRELVALLGKSIG